MVIRCKICGSEMDIAPTHKDFEVFKKNPNFPYICEYCSRKIQFEMQKANEIYKSLHKTTEVFKNNIEKN